MNEMKTHLLSLGWTEELISHFTTEGKEVFTVESNMDVQPEVIECHEYIFEVTTSADCNKFVLA